MAEEHIDTQVDTAAGAGTFSANGYSDTRDADTGIWYRIRAAGQDFWLNLIRQFWSIITALKPLTGFRLYVDDNDGALQFSLRAGKFWYAGARVSYAGALAINLTDDATNYVYAKTDGTIAISTSAFPDSTVTPHLPLYRVTTASGKYRLDSDVIDDRGQSVFAVEQAGGNYLVKVSKVYTDFSTAGLTITIDLFDLPAGHVVLDCYNEVVTAFGGTTTLDFEVGDAGDVDALMVSHDAKTAQLNTEGSKKGTLLTTAGETALFSISASTMLKCKATATVENLDQLSAGLVAFYFRIAANKTS